MTTYDSDFQSPRLGSARYLELDESGDIPQYYVLTTGHYIFRRAREALATLRYWGLTEPALGTIYLPRGTPGADQGINRAWVDALRVAANKSTALGGMGLSQNQTVMRVLNNERAMVQWDRADLLVLTQLIIYVAIYWRSSEAPEAQLLSFNRIGTFDNTRALPIGSIPPEPPVRSPLGEIVRYPANARFAGVGVGPADQYPEPRSPVVRYSAPPGTARIVASPQQPTPNQPNPGQPPPFTRIPPRQPLRPVPAAPETDLTVKGALVVGIGGGLLYLASKLV